VEQEHKTVETQMFLSLLVSSHLALNSLAYEFNLAQRKHHNKHCWQDYRLGIKHDVTELELESYALCTELYNN
jgi:hypothetical protein